MSIGSPQTGHVLQGGSTFFFLITGTFHEHAKRDNGHNYFNFHLYSILDFKIVAYPEDEYNIMRNINGR